MYFNRFDIVEAWWLALSHSYSGQNDPKYIRLCRMEEYFRPSPMLSEESLTENGYAIYTNILDNISDLD
jgi:hypothetical protein